MTEYRVWTSYAALAGECKIKAAAHAISVDRGDRRRREAGDGVHQLLSHLREAKSFGTAQGGDLVQVGSGGEEVRIAGDDQLGRVLRGEKRNRVAECAYARDAQSIGAVVRNETQNRDPLVPLNRAEFSFGRQVCRQCNCQFSDADLSRDIDC